MTVTVKGATGMAHPQLRVNIPTEVTPTAGPNVAATLGLLAAIRIPARRSGAGIRMRTRVRPRCGCACPGPNLARRKMSVISAQVFRSASGIITTSSTVRPCQ